MQHVINEIKTETLTIVNYFIARNSITDHIRETPVNILIFCTLSCAFFVFLLIVGIRETNDPIEKGVIIVSILLLLGRQILVGCTYLVQVVNVNGIADQCSSIITTHHWDNNVEIERIGVYMSIKEHPIGTKIFGVRPSKMTLLFQLGSIIGGMLFAVFYSVVLPTHNNS